jgi:PmbA protein
MPDLSIITQPQIDREAELNAMQSHVELALEQARKKGATATEISAHTSQGLAVSVRLGQVETLEHMQDRGINVTVLLGKRKGHASSADLSQKSIDSCVSKALEIARFTQEDPCNGLADEELLATEFPDLDIWHPAVLDATAAIERALTCEAAGRENQKITNSEGATFDAGLGIGVYGNSLGFIGRSAGTHFSQSCVLIAGKGDAMQRDYSFDNRRSLADLEPAEETGREAAGRAVRRLGAKKIKTARLPVLLASEVAKSLIGNFVGAISGSALYRNASFLKDTKGQKLFPEWVNLTEYPHLLRGAGSAAFDGEGVATRDHCIVGEGILRDYLLSSYSARRLGLKTTGNSGGVRNLLLRPGGENGPDLLAGMNSGLYVTEVMGHGVNLVTGDYSRGASGFMIKNGQISHPVEEVTIAGNLREMFLNMVAAGSRLDTRGNIHSGEILLAEMMVAGG